AIFILYHPKVPKSANIEVWRISNNKIISQMIKTATKGDREIINKYLISYL
ncbi:MAG: tRNA (5-methylaminomethyl-2-thiouridylate)-methyltransferase, partial [Candidatus Cloacimonetes bacterium]|nr:tRNA (5-methylaminomethyl-2-thiouridylate)-methyltransferase [Candidatus Cloacimonadota bacterium]